VFGLTRLIIFLAMLILTIVSMWTTYISLRDSILPEPVLPIPLFEGVVWQCSVFALLLSLALGLMLLGLKLAIIDGQKRLNALGIVGLTVVAFISISFNLDVLYRTADRDFYLRYSTDQMLQVYEEHLGELQSTLVAKRDALRTQVARQQVELDAEVEGIRQAPAGYGPRAREEEYALRLLESENRVQLESIEAALAEKERADLLLARTSPQSIQEVQELQNELRVLVRDAGAMAGIQLPEPVRLDSPIFAVFARLFDPETVGIKEFFLLAIAFFLDLGDIVGYCMIPAAAHAGRKRGGALYPPEPRQARLEYVPEWDKVDRLEAAPRYTDRGVHAAPEEEETDFFGESTLRDLPSRRNAVEHEGQPPPTTRKRAFRIRRK